MPRAGRREPTEPTDSLDPRPCPDCGRLVKPRGRDGLMAPHHCPHSYRCPAGRGDTDCLECQEASLPPLP